MSKLFCLVGLVWSLAVGSSAAREIEVIFTAEVWSLGGTLFDDKGVEPGMMAHGVLRYDTGTRDGHPADTTGWYYQHGVKAFELRVGDVEVLGSRLTHIHVENITGTDTFRVVDGHVFEVDREMTFNGERRNTLRLILAITDTTGQAFNSDDLPEEFPMAYVGDEFPFANTFSINDTGSNLSFRMRRMLQVEEPVVVPLEMESFGVDAASGEVSLEWRAVAGRRYGVEWSADLETWERLPGDVWAATGEGAWRGGGEPGYYRVVELGE